VVRRAAFGGGGDRHDQRELGQRPEVAHRLLDRHRLVGLTWAEQDLAIDHVALRGHVQRVDGGRGGLGDRVVGVEHVERDDVDPIERFSLGGVVHGRVERSERIVDGALLVGREVLGAKRRRRFICARVRGQRQQRGCCADGRDRPHWFNVSKRDGLPF